MKRKQKLENKRGITLIALIITIIVLLILAGVSIMMLAGENGILNRAVDASEATKEANAKELVGLAVMESIDETGKFNVEKFKELIEAQNGKVTEDGENLKVEIEGYEIEVNGKTGEIGEVTKVAETTKGIKAEVEIKEYQTTGDALVTGTKYSQIVLTVNIKNKAKIEEKDETIEVKVTKEDGTELEETTLVGEGYKSYTVKSNEIYTVTVTTNVDGTSEVTIAKESVTQINTPNLSTRAYGEIEVRFLKEDGNIITETANKPVLGENMTPVNLRSDNSEWEETTEEKWHYSYNNEAGTSEWANAVVKDESGNITGYFVWIPRYAYKIRYYNNSAHTTLVGYSDSRGIVNSNGSIVTAGTGRINAGDNFIVHPCFTADVNVGGWDKNLKGIWVAKYEASKETSSDGTTWSHGDTGNSSTGNVLTTNAGNASSTKVRMVSKPGVTSWRNIEIGKMYQNAEGYNKELNSHLMKNSEWGAVAYLSYSKYGVGWKTEVTQNTNSSYITGGSNTETTIYTTNKGQSTTGNAYGVYDMNGGAFEYVASYVNNGQDNLTTYGSSFAKKDKTQAKSDKFVTVYKASNSDSGSSSDDQQLNYNLTGENMFGDATYETSTSHSDSTGSWQGACASFPFSGQPFFDRGGFFDSSRDGVFYLGSDTGYGNAPHHSFRPVLAF